MRHISFDQLLGGSVPSLQHLSISGFDYEGLPSLLSSAPNLISFKNQYIRPQCYLSPEEMIEALAGLSKLRELIIAFSPFYPIHEFRSVGGSQSLGMCSQTHAVFPALTRLQIEGDKYLENLINLIDTPRLQDLYVGHPKPDHKDEELRASNLSQFISRMETFKNAQFKFRCAEVSLNCKVSSVVFNLPQDKCQQACFRHVISDDLEPDDWSIPFVNTVPHMTNWLRQLVIIISNMQYLSIGDNGIETMEKGHVLKNIDWLQLLCSFSAMEMLHVSGGLEKHITSALEDTPKEMVAQVLPVLQLLWLESLDYIQDNKKGKGKPEPVSVDQFLSLRKKSGHPVVVVKSHNEFIGRLNPYQSELIRLSESIRNINARGCDVVLV